MAFARAAILQIRQPASSVLAPFRKHLSGRWMVRGTNVFSAAIFATVCIPAASAITPPRDGITTPAHDLSSRLSGEKVSQAVPLSSPPTDADTAIAQVRESADRTSGIEQPERPENAPISVTQITSGSRTIVAPDVLPSTGERGVLQPPPVGGADRCGGRDPRSRMLKVCTRGVEAHANPIVPQLPLGLSAEQSQLVQSKLREAPRNARSMTSWVELNDTPGNLERQGAAFGTLPGDIKTSVPPDVTQPTIPVDATKLGVPVDIRTNAPPGSGS